MAIDRDLWLDGLTDKHVPAWPCPACGTGILELSAESLHEEETAASRLARAHGPIDMSFYAGHFSALFRCNHRDCGTPVAACGESKLINGPEAESSYFEVIHFPRLLSPAPPIFKVPSSCVEAIKLELDRAWSLYWVDADSCANRVRSSIELLLTHLKVPIKVKTKNGVRPLSLHQRIERFRTRQPELADNLMAIKWLGNAGSHGSGGLHREDVLDGLTILEHVLQEVFEQRTKSVRKLTRELIRSKGKRKRSMWDLLR